MHDSTFVNAFEKTSLHSKSNLFEVDETGEIYSGISHEKNPDWFGWDLINVFKTASDFPDNITWDDLKGPVYAFYKREFWDKLSGYTIASVSVPLAELLFDIGVTMGCYKAGRFLQRSINAMNRKFKDIPDLKLDGHIGQKTIEFLKQIIEREEDTQIIGLVEAQRLLVSSVGE